MHCHENRCPTVQQDFSSLHSKQCRLISGSEQQHRLGIPPATLHFHPNDRIKDQETKRKTTSIIPFEPVASVDAVWKADKHTQSIYHGAEPNPLLIIVLDQAWGYMLS